ncbi:MAG: hypothetical protein HXX13_17865 [Bacteroidetes bacterium]|nr:hypothetical protein [Bacteroidota bacterium]
MKHILLFTVFITLFILKTNAQVTPWTNEAKAKVLSDFKSDLATFDAILAGQKETLALCCLNNVVDKYSMTEYQLFVDLELKSIKNTIIHECSKKSGIKLGDHDFYVEPNEIDSWSKETRTNLYNKAQNYFNRYDLTQQQREMLSLCYTNEITKTFTKRDYDNLSEIELKRIKSELLKKCVDENKITLQLLTSKKLTMKGLAGSWQSDDFSISLSETGSMEKRMKKGKPKISKGNWSIESDKIIFVLNDLKIEYKVLFNSDESLKLEEISTKKVLQFAKIANF